MLENVRSAKVITCVLQRGRGDNIIAELYQHEYIFSVFQNTGRNQRGSEKLRHWQEVDMITVVVDKAHAESVFISLYEQAGIAEFEGGLIYQADLPYTTHTARPALSDLMSEELAHRNQQDNKSQTL